MDSDDMKYFTTLQEHLSSICDEIVRINTNINFILQEIIKLKEAVK